MFHIEDTNDTVVTHYDESRKYTEKGSMEKYVERRDRPSARRRRQRTVNLILIVLIAILLCVLITLIVLPKGKDDDKPESDTIVQKEYPQAPFEENGEILYRVRKYGDDPSTQIGAFKEWKNAVDTVWENEGYKVYDMDGNLLYAP